MMRRERGLAYFVLTALSLSIGWGIRGNFGHEYGAMIPGALAAMAGIALLAGIGAAGLGWWQPPAPHPVPALMFIVLSAAWCCWSRHSLAGAMDELKVWLWLVGGTVLAMEAYGRGLAMAPCLFALFIGVAMLWAGWRLVRFTAPAILRSGSEAP